MSRAIIATLSITVAAFSLAFIRMLWAVFGNIASASDFFGSAGVMMYLTIEFLFLSGVIAGAFLVIRKW